MLISFWKTYNITNDYATKYDKYSIADEYIAVKEDFCFAVTMSHKHQHPC